MLFAEQFSVFPESSLLFEISHLTVVSSPPELEEETQGELHTPLLAKDSEPFEELHADEGQDDSLEDPVIPPVIPRAEDQSPSLLPPHP